MTTCGRSHGSWSYKVDVPGEDGRRGQLVKGGFAASRAAEEAMAEVLRKAARSAATSLDALGAQHRPGQPVTSSTRTRRKVA